jgi:flagellar biosynthesis regulator FlaF
LIPAQLLQDVLVVPVEALLSKSQCVLKADANDSLEVLGDLTFEAVEDVLVLRRLMGAVLKDLHLLFNPLYDELVISLVSLSLLLRSNQHLE